MKPRLLTRLLTVLFALCITSFFSRCTKQDPPPPYSSQYNADGTYNGHPFTGTSAIQYPAQVNLVLPTGNVSYTYGSDDGIVTTADRNYTEIGNNELITYNFTYAQRDYPYADIPLFIVRKGQLLTGSNTTLNQQFAQFFSEGNYGYSIDANSGIEFFYTDAAGETWSTSFGTAEQDSTAFFAIDETVVDWFSTVLYAQVRADFQCTMYNSAGTSSMPVSGNLISVFYR